VGRSKQQSIFMVVVLPAPLVPNSENISPFLISILRLFTAILFPKHRVSWLVFMANFSVSIVVVFMENKMIGKMGCGLWRRCSFLLIATSRCKLLAILPLAIL
jgi:hypothetical protein